MSHGPPASWAFGGIVRRRLTVRSRRCRLLRQRWVWSAVPPSASSASVSAASGGTAPAATSVCLVAGSVQDDELYRRGSSGGRRWTEFADVGGLRRASVGHHGLHAGEHGPQL